MSLRITRTILRKDIRLHFNGGICFHRNCYLLHRAILLGNIVNTLTKPTGSFVIECVLYQYRASYKITAKTVTLN